MLPKDVQDKIDIFQKADQDFKCEWEKFELAQAAELIRLENLREERNIKLDEAKRAVRSEVETFNTMRVTFASGAFKVQKRWSDFYIPDKTVSMLIAKGLYNTAIAAGVVIVKAEVASYDEMQRFLIENNVIKEFECCEDGIEGSVAISGPKSIPPFGLELKKE